MDHSGHFPHSICGGVFCNSGTAGLLQKTAFPKELWLLKLTKYKCKLWYRELSTSSSLEKQGNYLEQSKEKQKHCCGHIALNINCIFSINLFHLRLLFRYCVIGYNSVLFCYCCKTKALKPTCPSQPLDIRGPPAGNYISHEHSACDREVRLVQWPLVSAYYCRTAHAIAFSTGMQFCYLQLYFLCQQVDYE